MFVWLCVVVCQTGLELDAADLSGSPHGVLKATASGSEPGLPVQLVVRCVADPDRPRGVPAVMVVDEDEEGAGHGSGSGKEEGAEEENDDGNEEKETGNEREKQGGMHGSSGATGSGTSTVHDKNGAGRDGRSRDEPGGHDGGAVLASSSALSFASDAGLQMVWDAQAVRVTPPASAGHEHPNRQQQQQQQQQGRAYTLAVPILCESGRNRLPVAAAHPMCDATDEVPLVLSNASLEVAGVHEQ